MYYFKTTYTHHEISYSWKQVCEFLGVECRLLEASGGLVSLESFFIAASLSGLGLLFHCQLNKQGALCH